MITDEEIIAVENRMKGSWEWVSSGAAASMIARIRSDAERITELEDVLKLAKQMNDEALPKFDWGKSCLDANAIDLLNRTPVAINKVFKKGTIE